jgi:hypothetical protein
MRRKMTDNAFYRQFFPLKLRVLDKDAAGEVDKFPHVLFAVGDGDEETVFFKYAGNMGYDFREKVKSITANDQVKGFIAEVRDRRGIGGNKLALDACFGAGFPEKRFVTADYVHSCYDGVGMNLSAQGPGKEAEPAA